MRKALDRPPGPEFMRPNPSALGQAHSLSEPLAGGRMTESRLPPGLRGALGTALTVSRASPHFPRTAAEQDTSLTSLSGLRRRRDREAGAIKGLIRGGTSAPA